MHARMLMTRLVLAGFLVGGTGVTVAVAGSPEAGAAPAQLTLNETWNAGAGVILNDAPCGVALSSPASFQDGATNAVEVGDRSGHLYGLSLANGSVVPGWGGGTGASVGPGQGCATNPSGGTPATGINGVQVPGSPPVDSTASVTGNGSLTFGAGNAAAPVDGGYYAYGSNGSEQWNQVVENPPSDTAPDGGVQASLPVANLGTLVEGGSLGQETTALNTSDGSNAAGWPQFSADSVFSTAATGDLYGTGSDTFAVGGASSAGFAYGKHYTNGGHLRIYNDHGGLVCSHDTDEEIDSSPAVGPILPGGDYGIATGTGSYWHGNDQNTVKVYDTKCQQVWSTKVDGTTGGSPALADIEGNGTLAVVEGTVTGTNSGSVWALNAATGATIWKTSLSGAVYGSVTTADLTGNGTQDVIVPTDQGLYILDGPTGQPVTRVDAASSFPSDAGVTPSGATFGFQNAALGDGGRQRVDRHHGRRILRRHGGQLRPGHRAALRGGRVERRLGRRPRRVAPVPPRSPADRLRGRRSRARALRPPGRGAARLPHRGLRRGDLRLRAGLLWQHGQPHPQSTRGRRGGRARSGGVLAGGGRRRDLLLR